MKHTKGTWYVERTSVIDGDFQGRILCKSSEKLGTNGKPQIYIIVGEPEKRNGRGNIYYEANAKLIAASPDLIEVLDLIIGSMSLERVERFDLLEKAKAAIKKATE